MTTMAKTYNEMTEFEIDEISSVDLPMQEGARAVILKRAQESEEVAKRVRLTSVEDGHQHLIDVSGDHGSTSSDMATGDEFSHSHPWVRNDDNSLTIGLSDGHTHTVIEKRLTEKDLTILSGESANIGGGQLNGDPRMTKTEEEIAKDAEAVEKRIKEAEARAEKAERLATMTDVQKAHYSALPEGEQPSFLEASSTDRQSAVEKAAGDDPVVYTTLAGEEIRKSAGSLLLNLAKRADENEKELAVEKAARQRDGFAKRAKEELANLPGKEGAQVALLKAIDGIPDKEDRDGALEIVKAANTGIAQAFEVAGTIDGGVAGDAEAKLEKLAQDHFKANADGSFAKSYKAVLETPEGRELFKETR